MTAASNTRACFEECVGKRIIGVLFDALPVERRDLANGNKTLVFDDGSGLTLSDSGAFWRESVDEIRRACDIKARELEQVERNIRDVLKLAGALAGLGA